MPKRSKTITVPVIVEKGAGGQFGIKDIPELVFYKNNDDLYRDGHYLIVFQVENKDGSSYRFADKDEGFWVQEASIKGPPKHQQLPRCHAVKIDDDGAELTVRNNDPEVELLKYTLNLVSPVPSEGPISLDPIMNNQNGGYN